MSKIAPKLFFSFALVAVIFCLTSNVYAQTQISSTGFTQGNIWFSQNKLEEGDKVKIFTALWNGEQDVLAGTVIFYDKSVVLGQKDITIQPDELKQSSIDWQVTDGDHSISAQIINAKTSKGETVYVSISKTVTNDFFVPKNLALIKNDPIKNGTTQTDPILSQVDKAGEFIKQNIPPSVSNSTSQVAASVDTWRDNTASTINIQKEQVNAEIKKLNEVLKANKTNQVKNNQSPVEKPFAYVKLFFLTLGSFIFSSKILFYGLSGLILFALIRFIWRKIRHG